MKKKFYLKYGLFDNGLGSLAFEGFLRQNMILATT